MLIMFVTASFKTNDMSACLPNLTFLLMTQSHHCTSQFLYHCEGFPGHWGDAVCCLSGFRALA